MLIQSRERDLGGGFVVRRVLPYAKKRTIGPFVFFDHMGPLPIDQTHTMDVRPHPHIGLATVTYLFAGHGYHRDTLGSKQLIQPGDINWMVAGSGIAHSERTPDDERQAAPGNVLHGIQIWVALPRDKEEVAPSFRHYPGSLMPELKISEKSKIKLLVGEYNGVQSPVETLMKTTYIDIHSPEADHINVSIQDPEVGVYLVSGQVTVNGQKLEPGDLLYLNNAHNMNLQTGDHSRVMIIGGEPLPEPRHIWWNFVSTSPERIRKAAQDWKEQKFGKIEGETEFIPLPDESSLP